MADTKIVVNCETGEVQEVELTAAEIEDRAKAQAAFEAEQKAADEAAAEKATQKQALLDRLGITAEEAALLLL